MTKTPEMVDRVAKLIAEYEAKGGHPFTTDQREIDRAIARIAIEAMREPTDAMTEAGWKCFGEVDERYQAMVNAALTT